MAISSSPPASGSSLNLSLAMERLGLRSLLSESNPACFDSQDWSDQDQQQQQQQILPSSEGINRLTFLQEEAALEATIVELIRSERWESLRPNSGNAVKIGQHHVCVSYSEEAGRTWEWHGHIMVYDAEEGYCIPEYVYGNYYEKLESCGGHHSGKSSIGFSYPGVHV